MGSVFIRLPQKHKGHREISIGYDRFVFLVSLWEIFTFSEANILP